MVLFTLSPVFEETDLMDRVASDDHLKKDEGKGMDTNPERAPGRGFTAGLGKPLAMA